MTTAFDRPFTSADITKAVDKFLELLGAKEVVTVTAGDLRRGMTIVEKVNGKKRYFYVHDVPVHKGHAVFVSVQVNGHRLNWRFENESPVHITGGN